MENTNKNWFRVKVGIEYSTDLNFFLQNQVGVSQKNMTTSFYSKLDGRTIHSDISLYPMDDSKILQKCKELHKEIMAGKIFKGEFVK